MKKILLILTILTFTYSLSHAFTPVLKYQHAGSYENWTEEAYYSSPTVYDLNGDGKKEIIYSNYAITVLDGATGKVIWRVNSGKDRSMPFVELGGNNGHTWSDAVVTDINGDNSPEIITGHGHGIVSVLSKDGYFLPGWPKSPGDESIRSIEVSDLDNDGFKEIVVGLGIDSPKSIYVYNYDGTLRNGWPQTNGGDNPPSRTYGIFMDNIAVSDLDGDYIKEIIVPSDLSFISIFRHDGSSFPANSSVYGQKNWGQIAFFEDYNAEKRNDNGGWGNPITGSELREDLYKGEFGHARAEVYDLDGNGKKEIIVPVLMCNRKYAPVYPPTEYMSIAIMNTDRTRYNNTAYGYNWETIPMDLGKPLFDNKDSMTSKVFQTVTINDINGDGKVELLFNSYNGKVHCFSLDKTEPYAWPFSLTKRTSPRYEYASPIVCKDLDNDGKNEVIFTSFYDSTQNYGCITGSLYILNYEGKLVSKTSLPPAKEAYNFDDGSMAAPTVDDIDGDGAYEIIVNTTHGAICVYDIK